MSAGEDHVKDALDYTGLALVARNHVLRGPDGSIEGEADLVYAFGENAFVIEVSTNAQPDAQRIKRKNLRKLHTGDLFARLSSSLGLPASRRPCAVYVNLSWEVQEGEEPKDLDGVMVLGDAHVDELLSGPPQRGLSVFLEWNGIPHDPRSL